MDAPTFRLTVVTPERTVYDGTVVSLRAPGEKGNLGVLAHHAALLTTLEPGRLDVREVDDSLRVFAVSGGFLEVADNVATLLADACEPVDSIDVMRAKSAAERARQRLASRDAAIDRARAEAALARALNRLKIAGA